MNGSNQLNITVSPNNRQEKEYICHVLFHEILRQEYNLSFSGSCANFWTLKGGSKLLQFPDLLSYPFLADHIPYNVQLLKLPLTPELDIPAIFYKGEYSETADSINFPIDIFASSFFMLSRWEESILAKPKHDGRFPASQSLAYKQGFLMRPVVNEYSRWLFNHLERLKFPLKENQEEGSLVLTHDVDMIRFGKLKRYAGDLLKHKSPKRMLYRLSQIGKNPWNTFDWLMDLSERVGVKSHFYVLPGGKAPMDRDFSLSDPLASKIIQRILEREHLVGFHPSYSSANDETQWAREKKRLECKINRPLTEGRQHYLRWFHDKTPNFWEKNEMQFDSSLGYHDHPGFRCGTGNEFSLYDLQNRRMRRVKERPLLFMEGTVQTYMKKGPLEALEYLNLLRSLSLKYKMPMTLLFHNSSFDNLSWKGWQQMYEKFIIETSNG